MPAIEVQGRGSATASISLRVGGDDVVPVLLKLGHSGAYAEQKMVPDAVGVKWRQRDGVWILTNVIVHGVVLNKSNGLPGKNRVSRDAFERRGHFNAPETTTWAADAPQWIKDAVAAIDPATF